MSDQANDTYDVVVIGGGAAGLNGALQLARSRRSVLVVDAGQQRNRPAPAVHGLLGHDGRPPGELLARGRHLPVGVKRDWSETIVNLSARRLVSTRPDWGRAMVAELAMNCGDAP